VKGKRSRRIEGLEVQFFASLVPVINQLLSSGVDVIRLDIGSPDLPPTQRVVDALARSAQGESHHGYQPHKGILPLREAWVSFYRQTFKVELDPDLEVVPLLGSKEGIFHLCQALLNPSDVALIPDPGYLTYASGAFVSGAEPFFLELRQENDYLPDLGEVPKEIAERARVLWLNYPNNPTGAVANEHFFTEVLSYAREHDILVCHDAAYSAVTYDGYRAPSILEFPGAKEVAVEFNSLSKSHNMAGWRVGVAVGNSEALGSLYTLKTHTDSGQFLPIMEAAIEAMTGDQGWIGERNEVYRKRRDLVAEVLQDLGVDYLLPKGAIYMWFACPTGWTSARFTQALLKSTGVSLAPGSIFGDRGESFIRLSLCAPEDRLADAMKRMADWWSEIDAGEMKGGSNG
jgi:LL-diaminopimelate aminotransferase